MPRKLFEAIVDEEHQSLGFKSLLNRSVPVPARDELEDTFADFTDIDGDFVLKFQSDAFEARLFELYLFAVFRDMGFRRADTFSRPDFVLERCGVELAVEAVTANPSQGDLPAVQPPREGEDFEAMFTRIMRTNAEKQRELNAGVIRSRLARPLTQKLRKAYWTLPHVQGKPLVIAAQDFHAEGALLLLTEPYAEFLYGDFFQRGETENVSAVLLANAGTASKFGRMRLQRDPTAYPLVTMFRVGWYYPSREPGTALQVFYYTVGDAAWRESWVQGITVFHNPAAMYPEPPRDSRRLQSLRRWSHGTTEQSLTRGSGAGGSTGARDAGAARVGVGSHQVGGG